ncbi:MAG: aminotransferase class I/II-fold pyridoxal phosphate-dependent enzyme [Pseudomonadota bacterium]
MSARAEQTAARAWMPEVAKRRIAEIEGSPLAGVSLRRRIGGLAEANREIHETACFNLNPATNVMNPAAEAFLASGLGARPSLGPPGEKYEMGLEAIEEIEVHATRLAQAVFGAQFAEIRVPSGAMANLFAFMATCKPGDSVLVPPAEIAGHVTHHAPGCAGLYGLEIHEAPVDPEGYTVDLAGLTAQAEALRPRLITLGGSLNLWPHPVAEVRAIADRVGAHLLVDAAHQCGLFAGRAWPNPLDQGAHLMTLSTYKSLGGPAGGVIVTNEADLAERLDAIAFPGMTANFDVAKSAALAVTLLDWQAQGSAYASAMISLAEALAEALEAYQVAVFRTPRGVTSSHQFALEAPQGGQALAKHLRRAGFLASGIGLPRPGVAGDMNGLRLGTPELVRWGVGAADAPALAALIARALASEAPETLAPETAALRQRFDRLHFIEA